VGDGEERHKRQKAEAEQGPAPMRKRRPRNVESAAGVMRSNVRNEGALIGARSSAE